MPSALRMPDGMSLRILIIAIAGDRHGFDLLVERAEAKNPSARRRCHIRARVCHEFVPLLDQGRRTECSGLPLGHVGVRRDLLLCCGPNVKEHAYRTAINMGIPVAGHSDSPISAADPLLRIQDMVTRTSSQGVVVGGDQKVDVDEAIKVWTLDGAYATFEENIKGSITPGKLADFVVLQKDPRKVPPNTIKDITLEATYLAGNKVYTAPSKAVAMLPQPPINYGDGNYGDGDEEENQIQ